MLRFKFYSFKKVKDSRVMEFYVFDVHALVDDSYTYGEDFGKRNLGPSMYCPCCGVPLISLSWLPPYEIRTSRKRIGDFIMGFFNGIFISPKVKQLFDEHGIRGISGYSPTKVYFRGKVISEDYLYPHIEMSTYRYDERKSKMRYSKGQGCDCCQLGKRLLYTYGFYFEDAENIDMDIFYTRFLGRTIVVSERVRNLIIDNNLTSIDLNLHLINIHDYKFDY